MKPSSQTDNSTQGASALSERLGNVRVGVRRDLEVTRHVFRKQPSYVIREPMSMQSFQLQDSDYAVFRLIDASRTLGETFNLAVEQGLAEAEDQESFYTFILALHRLSFLSLPIADDQLLYRRFQSKRAAKRKEKFMTALFLRIPLVNPDTFLDDTYRYVRPLFSKAAFYVWLVVMVSAAVIALQQGQALAEPAQGVLLMNNLPLLWVTLIVLKLFHELGHAYACKHFGGQVPEMGMMLIILTPAAYVDASACWSFTRKRDRIIVCLAGMYVEFFLAAVAMIFWALSSPGLIRDISYNVVFLASAVTVLFNINPLMRFDGYYVLSDWLEIPNLRQRSTSYVQHVLKSMCLGARSVSDEVGRRLQAILLIFGLASTTYRFVIVLAICSLVAFKLSTFGLLLAGTYLAFFFGKAGFRCANYLWFSGETAPMRNRAVSTGCILLTALALLFFALPIPSSVVVNGVFAPQGAEVIRAEVEGFVETVAAVRGDSVNANEVVLKLRDDVLVNQAAVTAARVHEVRMRESVHAVESPAKMLATRSRLAVLEHELDHQQILVNNLAVRASRQGRVIWALDEQDVGTYIQKGDMVAKLAQTEWQVKTVMTAEQIADLQPRQGQIVSIRSEAQPQSTVKARISHIATMGSRTIELASLTHEGGGDIAIDSDSKQAQQPYFMLKLDIIDDHGITLQDGLGCRVRMGTVYAPMGTLLGNKLRRFINQVMQG